MTADSERLRGALVEELTRGGCLTAPAVRAAFLAVPRELFVADFASREGLAAVYRDEAILTKHDQRGAAASSSSQPAIMALMLERLDVRPGDHVLEVGGGTGYNAALLSTLVGDEGQVVSVELDPGTAREAEQALAAGGYAARVVTGDGRDGWGPAGPYDRIIVTASSERVYRPWFDQVVEGGLLELPLRLTAGPQPIPTFRKHSRSLRSVSVLCGAFMPLRASAGAASDQPPSVSASAVVDGAPTPLVQLAGDALRTLSARSRRRLLALALSEPRTLRLGRRAPAWALSLYLSLTLPRNGFVVSPPRAGVISRDGRSLALLAGRGEVFDRILAYGDGEAEDRLVAAVERWNARGRPAEDELTMQVTFRDGRSRVACSWSSGART